MGFRSRLVAGITAAVLITALLYGVLGLVTFRRSLDQQVTADIETVRRAITRSLDLSGPRPLLRPDASSREVLSEYGSMRFRLLRAPLAEAPTDAVTADQVLLEFGGAYPEQGVGWRRERFDLGDGYLLEVAFDVGEVREALASYLRTGLLVLPAVLAVAVLLALGLQRLLLTPLRELRDATQMLSRQAIPEPVSVPPGRDELAQLAESFNRMTASLHAFLERERSFTRYASHELRTPLTNLQLLLQGLERGMLDPADSWPKVTASLARIEAILSGLLTLTRAPELRSEPVPLELVVDSVMSSLPAADRQRVTVRRRAFPIVLGREGLLRQVVGNLVRNALRYGGEPIYLTLDETATDAVLWVRDHGPGVPEEALDKLTQPFFRVGARSGESGLGLGLALVEHVVTSLGGSFTLRNASPGLEARITLPRIESPVGDDDEALEDEILEESAVNEGAVKDSAVKDSAVKDSAVKDSAVKDSAVKDRTVEDEVLWKVDAGSADLARGAAEQVSAAASLASNGEEVRTHA